MSLVYELRVTAIGVGQPRSKVAAVGLHGLVSGDRRWLHEYRAYARFTPNDGNFRFVGIDVRVPPRAVIVLAPLVAEWLPTVHAKSVSLFESLCDAKGRLPGSLGRPKTLSVWPSPDGPKGGLSCLPPTGGCQYVINFSPGQAPALHPPPYGLHWSDEELDRLTDAARSIEGAVLATARDIGVAVIRAA